MLVKDQAPMNCGRSAGIIEYPSRLRISAPHTAATMAAEGPAGAELAEVNLYHFRSTRVDSPRSTIIGVGIAGQPHADGERGPPPSPTSALAVGGVAFPGQGGIRDRISYKE